MRMPYRSRGRRRTNLAKVGKAARKAKQYTKPANMASVVSIAKSVTRLRKSIRKDRELKTFTYGSAIGTVVGQVSGNNTGAYLADLNLNNNGAGVGPEDRIGVKCQLKGIQLRMQFSQQSNASTGSLYVIEVWKTADFGATMNSIRDSIFNNDSISSVVDFYSSYNKEYFDIYKRVAKKVIKLGPDNSSGINEVRDVKMFIKQNQQLTYASTSTAVPQNVRYFISIRSSVGNSASSTASTLPNVVHTTALTGSVLRYTAKTWYIDN